MKNITLLSRTLIGICSAGLVSASAQFPIKIPKIKVDKPAQVEKKTEAESSQPAESSQTRSSGNTVTTRSSFETLPNQVPPNKPVFLLNTLLVRARTEPRYYKLPNVNDNTSWYPQVQFDVFYDNSVRQRFVAEWFNPDGSPWFTEPLELVGDQPVVTVRSADSQEQLSSNAVQSTGIYGFKVTNSKTGEVVYQGKFNVKKLQPEADLKKKFLYYVDNDWNLPIGYVSLYAGGGLNFDSEVYPTVEMYLKGEQNSKDLEAQLFFNGQQIASTDEGGWVTNDGVRGEECYQFKATCQQTRWIFRWDKFQVQNVAYVRTKYPNAIFTRDKPGEYAVKVFYKGMQIREARFAIDQKGWIAQSPYSNRLYPFEYRVAIPVKVTGTMEKWNPTTWKTDAFYGNPLDGFSAQ